ncbi:Bug family tripartite tricarboxylate transporter substrate binding protein [Variovorax sp. VNK109]|uniref:Bug family tripartite tricarboxylate transporter substrate binding protein n=1 Tax=Variovorax sp. VNK109 TaxID=3400919 RepID=UPI003BFC1199
MKLLVGFPPGSSPDFIARALAEPLSKALGQPVVVENRVGASGNIATAAVAQSTDQHTLGVVINGNMTVAKLLNPATPYDPLKDLMPVSLVCRAPLLLAASDKVPAGNAAEFRIAARAAGAKWNYGSPGIGTIGHLAMETFKARAGIAPVHVPYPSYQRVVMAMLADEVQVSLVQLGAAMPMVASGKLKALGITAATRTPLAPEFPTLAEAGLPSLELEVWTGIAAPAGMPPEIVSRLSSLLATIAKSDDIRRQMANHGYEAVGMDAATFAQRIRSDYDQLSHIIKTQGIKVE